MKLFVLRVVLCVLLINEFADSNNTQSSREEKSVEFEDFISKFAPEFQLNASRMFHESKFTRQERKINETFIKLLKETNETLTKQIKNMDRERFSSTACSVKDNFQIVWANHVNPYTLNQTKAINDPSAIAKNPPELADKQIHCPSHVKFIQEIYPKWLHYINNNQSKFANDVRLGLRKAGLNHEQFAWSGPKLYKHYQLYSYQSQSEAIVTLDEFNAIEKLMKGKIHGTDYGKIIRSKNHAKILTLMKNNSTDPEFMDYLEEFSDWYITAEDCQIISIVRAALKKAPIECKAMKKYPDRAVPFTKLGYASMYEEGCLPFIGSLCESETTSTTLVQHI